MIRFYLRGPRRRSSLRGLLLLRGGRLPARSKRPRDERNDEGRRECQGGLDPEGLVGVKRARYAEGAHDPRNGEDREQVVIAVGESPADATSRGAVGRKAHPLNVRAPASRWRKESGPRAKGWATSGVRPTTRIFIVN